MNEKQLDRRSNDKAEVKKSQVKAQLRKSRSAIKAQFKAAVDNRYMDMDELYDLESQGAW